MVQRTKIGDNHLHNPILKLKSSFLEYNPTQRLQANINLR